MPKTMHQDVLYDLPDIAKLHNFLARLLGFDSIGSKASILPVVHEQ